MVVVRKSRVGGSRTTPGEAREEVDAVAREARVASAERGGRYFRKVLVEKFKERDRHGTGLWCNSEPDTT